MKASALKYFILSMLASVVCLIIVVMPFHAFLTVWLSTLVGHYTALRLWKEVLLLICTVGCVYLVLVDHKIRTHTLTRRLVWLIIVYGLWVVLRGLLALHSHSVTRKALGYGALVDVRFLVFFLVTWAVAVRTVRLKTQWPRLVLWPAYGVIGFALLQIFVLPHNFLSHFGYNTATTIPPFETINNNSHYIRIESTLRGANPLGAYLLIPISLLMAYIVAPAKRNKSHIFLLIAALIALCFSFSRSAWLGAFISLVIILAVHFKPKDLSPKLGFLAGIVVVALAVLAIGMHHNTRFENVFLHTQDHSASAVSSNAGHASALKDGLRDMVHHPFGSGPGTAGPASVYNVGQNKAGPNIAEDYFVQVGQETGWLGLGLFLLINIGVGYLLWLRRADPLSLSLFASLIGLSFVNLLSHAWADDTLAYVWWGLAGVAMAQQAYRREPQEPKTDAV
jgi:hypothetical protein